MPPENLLDYLWAQVAFQGGWGELSWAYGCCSSGLCICPRFCLGLSELGLVLNHPVRDGDCYEGHSARLSPRSGCWRETPVLHLQPVAEATALPGSCWLTSCL